MAPPGGDGADDLVRAQGHFGHAESHRPQPGRALGAPPDLRRRDQADLQGRPAARPGRLLRLQAGPVPLGHPGRADLHRRAGRGHHHHRQPHLRAPGGRPADRDPARAGHVGHRGLRRHAGRLVVGVEVPAARLGAGLGPGHLLRGRARPDHRHGGAGQPLALHPGHRGLAVERLLELEPDPPRLHPLHLLHDRHHGRADPAPLRPDRGRAGAGRAASTPSTPPSASASSSWPSS